MVKGLTKEQAKRLQNRQTARPSDRANADYKMAKKLQKRLDDLAGLLLIMKAIPPEKLRRGQYIKDRHVRLLFELSETAIKTLNYKKVRESDGDLYILEEKNREAVGVEIQTGKPIKEGEFHRRKPTKEEMDRADFLWNHMDYLKGFAPDMSIEKPGIVNRLTREDQVDRYQRRHTS